MAGRIAYSPGILEATRLHSPNICEAKRADTTIFIHGS
jgi:hypothetical protein